MAERSGDTPMNFEDIKHDSSTNISLEVIDNGKYRLQHKLKMRKWRKKTALNKKNKKSNSKNIKPVFVSAIEREFELLVIMAKELHCTIEARPANDDGFISEAAGIVIHDKKAAMLRGMYFLYLCD